MKKVLATGLNGMFERCVYVGAMDCFSRMKISSRQQKGISLIDSTGRNFVDNDNLILHSFESITQTPPDVLAETSAILCFSAPEITIQVISIAEHYSIPIVVTGTGIKMEDDAPCDLLSETNLRMLQEMSKETPVFYCQSDSNAINALKYVAKDGRKSGLYTTTPNLR